MAGRGDGGDGDWAKAKDFAVLDHAIDLGPVKGHNDVILRILAAHLAGLKPRNRLARAIRVAPVAALIAAMPPTWSICS